MSRIPSITEQQLKGLAPTGLDESFLARLTACAEGTATELSATELDFEARLRALKPRSVPAALEETIFASVRDTPFAVDDKIVLFHKSSSRKEPAAQAGKRSNIVRFNLAAAAAVAAMGTIAALMLPGGSPAGPAGPPPMAAIPAPALTAPAGSSNFAPASYNRNLRETRDEGVIWQSRNQPHRVLRLTYMDRVTMTNENGETIEVEQPRTEYVIIPEKID